MYKIFCQIVFLLIGLYIPFFEASQSNLLLSNWERNEMPVLDGFMHAYQPEVIEVPDDEFPYRMWFMGWIVEDCNPEYLGCDGIFHARSKDLKHWEVFCKDGSWDTTKNIEMWAAVVQAPANAPRVYDAGNTADLAWSNPKNRGNSYDTWHCGDPSVVYKDGIFYMAFSITSYDIIEPVEGYPNGLVQSVMGATSVDGIHWKRTEKPLLIAKEDLNNKFPPDPAPNRIGDFHRPSLLWDEENVVWKLYFDYSLNKGCHMGMAENKGDFRTGDFKLVHPLDLPLLWDWPNPDIVKISENLFYSFADPGGYKDYVVPKGKENSSWPSRQLHVAKSNDGIHWEKQYTIPPDSGIDACHTPQALLCKKDGKKWLYIFHATQVGWRETGFQYNRFEGKKDEYNWFYDQIRFMRQEIK